MFKTIAVMFSLLLLSACQSVNSETDNNQFQIHDEQLLFDNEMLVMWTSTTIPSCQQCNLTTHSKKTAAGPILFTTINNEHGELILESIKKARHSFAFKVGKEQHSIRLKIADRKLSVSLNQAEYLILNKHEKRSLNIADSNYFIKLDRLYLPDKETKGKTSEQATYEADIVIWLDQAVK
ncbi:hypothetical protein [Psychromonas sp. Urea-02u-13]|uniref:hypothetical protein n=1 Tax=Psychromonas sp. Urea-02u-13 TaxID=2058326 RepID=UPI000C34E9DE|nr:hypothetical protein [Psychromonas sp. Urea-02u-13]PKG39755.1 hypothetical protein CXF74_06775 [Psychromonas sp. Urea-02u-13]